MVQIRSFLVNDAAALDPTFDKEVGSSSSSNAPVAATMILSLGVKASAPEVTAFAKARAPATTFFADCYGIVGFDAGSGKNVEIMEKGRGKEYGGAGGDGGQGLVVAAFLGDQDEVVATSAKVPDNAAAHIVVATDRPTDYLGKNASAVYVGGIAKGTSVFDHEKGTWTSVPWFAVSLLNTCANLSIGSTSFTSDPTTSIGNLAKSTPAGQKVQAIASFPCFMRGKNEYGKNNVEPDAMNAALPGVRAFGMFCHGELGPKMTFPIAAASTGNGGKSPALTCGQHSMTTCLAMFAMP